MKKVVIVFLVVLTTFVSCKTYKNSASSLISISEIKIGMDKQEIVTMLGQPFSFNIWKEGNDTLSELSYKTPKVVANCAYVITSRFIFVGNRLVKISQEDLYIPETCIYCDSTKRHVAR